MVLAHRFGGFICYHHGSSMVACRQTVVLEELRALHLNWYAAGREKAILGLTWACETSNPPPWHTFSIKTTPIPTGPCLLLILLPMSLWGHCHLNHHTQAHPKLLGSSDPPALTPWVSGITDLYWAIKYYFCNLFFNILAVAAECGSPQIF